MNKERPQARSFFVPGKGRYDPGQPEDGEDGGDNGDADAPVGEDAAPVAPQSSEDGESNEVVSPVTKENAVAQIGDTYYATLPAALEAANDGDTVKMLKDYTSDKNDLFTMIFVKKQLTLDLNVFDIDSLTVGQTWDLSGSEPTKRETPLPGDLTITDTGSGIGRVPDLELAKGKLTIEVGEIGTRGGTTSFVCSDETGEVNINGGKVWYFCCEGGTANINGGKVFDLSVSGSQTVVNISNGTNHGGWNDGSEDYGSAIWSVDGGTLDISGGTFQNISNRNNSSVPVKSLLADGYAFANSDGSIVNGYKETNATYVTVVSHTHSGATCACGAECPHANWQDGKCAACGYVCTYDKGVDADSNCSTCGVAIVAKVGVSGTTTYHADITAALEAAKDNGTLTVIAKEQTLALPDKNGYPVLYADGTLTLDLNGHTLSGGGLMVGGGFGSSHTGELTVTDSTGGSISLRAQPKGTVYFKGKDTVVLPPPAHWC